MNIAAVMVATRPEYLGEVKARIESFEWAEVHHEDDTGRMIVTIEGESNDEDVTRLREVKGIPHVASAEMVEYYFEDEMKEMHRQVHEEPVVVPEYLTNDSEEPPDNLYNRVRKLSNF